MTSTGGRSTGPERPAVPAAFHSAVAQLLRQSRQFPETPTPHGRRPLRYGPRNFSDPTEHCVCSLTGRPAVRR